MAARHPSTVADRFVAAIVVAAGDALGRSIASGTTVVGATDRSGSSAAVAYALGDHTIVWCDPALVERLAPLNQPNALSIEEFVAAAVALGGELIGMGNHRVLEGPPTSPPLDPTMVLRAMSRDDAADRASIGSFLESCPSEDVEEAEIELDDLDPAIVVVTDSDGEIAAFASARAWSFDSTFDDIGVLTSPTHRGRGFGASAVAELINQQQATGRTMFYNCDTTNLGSDRLAQSLGFELVHVVAGVTFR